MTVLEALTKAQKLRPGTSMTDPEAPAQLLEILNRIEAGVQTDMLLMFRPEAIYKLPQDEDETLLVPPPYDDMYVQGMLAEIDYAMGDMAQHNNSVAKFNQRQADAQKWIIRNYDPKHHDISVRRQDPVIEWGKAGKLVMYGCMVDRANATAASINVSQYGESTNINALSPNTGVTYEGTTITYEYSAAVASAFKAGSMNVGYTVTDTDGVTWVNKALGRFYVKKDLKGVVSID